jgi:holo-[acyl-carrier protein] synthase
VLYHGVDITPVARIHEMLGKHSGAFIAKCFTPAESAYCEKAGRRDEHYAARFAAKEAILKALGTGWGEGLGWLDVEVGREPSGRPTVILHGAAATHAAKMGITRWTISLSHTDDLAIASVIAEATDE